MRHQPIVSRTTGYAHQLWLASLGALEILQKQGKQIFNDLVKEGKSVKVRSGPEAYGQAKDSRLAEAVLARKEAYQRKFEARLQEWDAQLEQLAATANKAKADARAKIEDELASLKAQRTAVQQKLDALRNAGEHAWEDLKDGVENAWDDISGALGKALAHFK